MGKGGLNQINPKIQCKGQRLTATAASRGASDEWNADRYWGDVVTHRYCRPRRQM